MRIAGPVNRSPLAKNRVHPVLENAADPRTQGRELGGSGDGPHVKAVAEPLRLCPRRADAANQRSSNPRSSSRPTARAVTGKRR